MSKPELKDQLKSLESYFNDVPLVLDPCKMCLNYDEEKGYKEKLMRIPEFSEWLRKRGSLLNGSI